MVSMVPVSQTSSSESQPLLSNTKDDHAQSKSLLYRARRAPLAVACVAAIALFVDMVVYGVVVPILPDIVKRLGGTSRDAGLLFACYAIGLLGSTPVFAYLSDHYHNRRYPMMGGMLGMAIATFCFANANSYWMLFLARIGQGMAGGASWTIGLGMLADVYPPHKLGVVMGACLMFNTMGFLIGPTLGGTLYEYYGLHAPFAVCAGLALLDFFAVVFIAEPEKNKPAQGVDQGNKAKAVVDEETAGVAPVPAATEAGVDNSDEEDRDTSSKVANYGSISQGSTNTSSSSQSRSRASTNASASSVASNETSSSATASIDKKVVGGGEALEKVDREDDIHSGNKSESDSVGYFEIATEWTIIRCLLATLVTASAYSGIEPIFPLHLQDILGAGPALTGLVFTSAVVPSLLSPLIGYIADRTDRLVVATGGMIVFATALIWLSWPTTIAGFIMPLALFGLGSSTCQTPILPAMAQVATERGWNAYARVYACYNMMYSGGMMIGPILAGILYDWCGFGWTMFAFGVVGFAMIPFIFGNEIVSLARLAHRILVR